MNSLPKSVNASQSSCYVPIPTNLRFIVQIHPGNAATIDSVHNVNIARANHFEMESDLDSTKRYLMKERW